MTGDIGFVTIITKSFVPVCLHIMGANLLIGIDENKEVYVGKVKFVQVNPGEHNGATALENQF